MQCNEDQEFAIGRFLDYIPILGGPNIVTEFLIIEPREVFDLEEEEKKTLIAKTETC